MTAESSSLSPPAPLPAAVDVVDTFVRSLRRHDLNALAALLRSDAEIVAPRSPNDRTPGPAGDPDECSAGPAVARTALDGAQIVLRSFSGSGLVEAELHPSTDGRTVFVEFRPDHPTPGPAGYVGRLLRFTTSGGSITRIREYTDSVDPAPPVAAGATEPGSARLDWPTLGPDRSPDHRADGP